MGHGLLACLLVLSCSQNDMRLRPVFLCMCFVLSMAKHLLPLDVPALRLQCYGCTVLSVLVLFDACAWHEAGALLPCGEQGLAAWLHGEVRT